MYSERNINAVRGIDASGALGVSDLPRNVLNVYSDGTISIPYIGRVEVQNLTVLEAKKVIGDKFKKINPDASVDVTLRNRVFFVLGEAGSRMIFMNSMRMNIYQALSQSGVISTYGDRKNVKIVRQTATGTEVKTFDLRSKDVVDSDYYYIQPNDVIYVQQMQRKFWGSITSFSSIFGFITGMLGMVTLVYKLIK
jgi:polysaccharide export outer membrane protein